jgi:DNA polymerase family A
MGKENKAIVIDIESSALLADMLDFSSFPYKLKPDAKLWCVVLRNIYTDEVIVAEKENITKEWLKENLEGCTHLIGHNIIKFDFLTLKLFGILDYTVGYLDEEDTLFGEPVKIIDTLILSRLFNPDRFNGHSLESWGERVGAKKMDFRGELIKRGIIPKDSPKGFEFKNYTPLMLTYCIQDTEVNKNTFFSLLEEMGDYKGWNQAIKMENKLADLAIRRESFGFWFDKDLAVKCVEDLTQKMEDLQNKVNPLLPPKPMTKTELSNFTPPTTQFLKSGKPSTHIIKFANRVGGFIEQLVSGDEHIAYVINFEGKRYPLPHNEPLKTHVPADISNLDHVKMTLIDVHNWIPTEWAERDLTKDSKKQSISIEKRVKALERWYNDTMDGKYQKLRLKIACERFKVKDVEELFDVIKSKLDTDFPVRVPTSPKVRVGVEKELCPNLTKLGEDVEFANDFALFLTYKHRKSSIAGGEIEDMDFDLESPNTGYLSMYREEDGRVSTPAIEIGASSCRYRHIGIANVARSSSIYGKEMRSLFGSGKDGVQLGFDFASLEARIQGHYCWKYTDGQELAKTLLAEKPFDIHTVTGERLGIPRSDAKSVNYMLIYGGKIPKVQSMLNVEKERATEIYNLFWDSVPALEELKQAIIKHWKDNDKKFITGIDGRKIITRSEHSLLNSAFQSAGVIAAKYVTVIMMQELENKDYNIDPFKDKPDVCSMIEYHDECQLFLTKKIPTFKIFSCKEEAKEFVDKWEGVGQLSAVSEGKFWYVCTPNDVSLAIEKAIKDTEIILKLNVELGYEWIVSSTWHGCH